MWIDSALKQAEWEQGVVNRFKAMPSLQDHGDAGIGDALGEYDVGDGHANHH